MPPDETRIRIRAYAIWEAEGRPHGRDAVHWHEALRQLMVEDEAAAPPAKKPVRKPPARKATVKAEPKPAKEAPKRVAAKAAPAEPAAPAAKRPARAKAAPAP